ncbi:hypothetical protein CCP3SC15_300016 [Gammaproteobacteria bacterium]
MAYPYQTNPFQPTTLWNTRPKTDPAAQGTTQGAPGTPPPPPAGSTVPGNNQVLQTAQQAAIGNAANPSTTLKLTSDKTQQLLQNPSGAFNPTSYKQLTMDQYNRGQAQQLEALRQQTAPVANTGKNLQDLIGTALQIGEGRVDLSRSTDLDIVNKQQQDLINAIAQGNSTAGTESTTQAQAINNLVNVRGAAEGQENRAATATENEKTRQFQAGQNALYQVPAEDQVYLQQQGIDINKASQFGYQRADGTWVKGTSEIAAEKLGIDMGDYNLRKTELLGGVGADGKYIDGKLQQSATALGLQAKTIENQEKELWGFTDANGQKHQGKYDLLTAEQKQNADKFYGYFDSTGKYQPGEFAQERQLLEMQQAFAVKGIQLNAVIDSLQNMPGDQAFGIIAQFAKENGVEIPPLSAEVQENLDISDITTKLTAGERITPEDYAKLADNDAFMRSIPDASQLPDFSPQWEGSGKNRWIFKPETVTWLDAHQGGLIKQNGQIYRVVGYFNPQNNWEDRGKKATVTLESVATGATATLGGGGEPPPLGPNAGKAIDSIFLTTGIPTIRDAITG